MKKSHHNIWTNALKSFICRQEIATQGDELKLLQQDELAVTVAAVTGTLFYLLVNVWYGARGVSEPAILISRLLLLIPCMNEWNAQNAIWSRAFGLFITRNVITRVDYLSRETYAKHNDGAKAFDLRSLSPALCDLC